MISNFEPPECIWSIGIYTGNSPLHLSPAPSGLTPVLTAADVTDVPGAFVADPFLVRDDGEWFMFFEMLSSETGRGENRHGKEPQWPRLAVPAEHSPRAISPFVSTRFS